MTTSGNGPPRWLAGLLESAKQKVNANLPAPPQRLRDFNPGPLDVTSLRQRASVRLQWGGIAVGVLGLVIIALVLRESACGSAAGVVEAIPVQLSVFSRPRTTVRVVPPPGTKQRKPVVLGQTPLDSVSGAFANDVIELTDSDRGLRYEQVVMAAMPGEQVRIEKTFREGTLKVFTRPAAPQATLWKEGELVGKIGVPIKLYEGRHHLEIRADALSQPVEFEVEISPGEIQVKDVSLPGGPN